MIATCFVLINVSMGQARAVYEKLGKVKNVQRADAVTGPYDIVAVIQGRDFQEVARTVLDRVQTIEGVTQTITCPVVSFEV